MFNDIETVRTYIDDLLVVTNGSFEEHLGAVDTVLQRLQNVGLKINTGKSQFFKTELEYLGYWITRNGIQPLPNKINAIPNITLPKNKSELLRVIGLVNYY